MIEGFGKLLGYSYLSSAAQAFSEGLSDQGRASNLNKESLR